MPNKIYTTMTDLQEFGKSRDIGAIARAVDALEEFDVWSIKPDQRLEARHRLVVNWCRALVAIDSVKEPGFDPDADRIAINPSPPPGYPSGVSPKSVRDAKARAQYEAAIAEHEKKKARDRAQLLAIELEDRAVGSAHQALERLYTSSAADRKEIDAVFQEASLS